LYFFAGAARAGFVAAGPACLTADGLQLAALALLAQGAFLVGGAGRESAVGLWLSLADVVADFGQV